jgi:hypothetical protein
MCIRSVADAVFPELMGTPSEEWMVEEHIDVGSGYSFDVYIPSVGLVIEVDGPTHYITDLPRTGADTGPATGGGTGPGGVRTLVPSGKTLMKRWVLRNPLSTFLPDIRLK